MPRKAKRPCRYRNCPELTDSESGYCCEHEKQMNREAHRQYNRNVRSAESKKRYGGKWRQIRASFLKINPLCEMCRRQGKYKLANEVHHVKAMVAGGTHEFENLMALCKSCHSKITAAEKQGRG